VVHGSHSSITIYYAKLPNEYLSEISAHGSDFLTHSTYKERVHLRRTKKFHMGDPGERVDLFCVLAKLLWYLKSGLSHVGYLYNHESNPMHRIVSSPLNAADRRI